MRSCPTGSGRPAGSRRANQPFDLTFCPVNPALRADCQGKKSVNSAFGMTKPRRHVK